MTDEIESKAATSNTRVELATQNDADLVVAKPTVASSFVLVEPTSLSGLAIADEHERAAPIDIGYESSKRIYAYMSIIGALAVSLLAFVSYQHRAHFPLHLLALFSLMASFLWGISAYLLWFAKPPIRLTISEEGMLFTGSWQIELLARMHRQWKDIHTIYLTGFDGPRFLSKIRWESINYFTANPQVQIVFKSGGSAHIKLPLLTRAQAATVLEAITLYSDPSRLASDMVKLKEALLSEESDLSFTQLWSQDLELRHGSTHFVPLSSGNKLRDGSIRIIREIATGGLSAVYLAEDHNKKKVVLKESVLPLDMNEDSRQKARELFSREARLLMKLHHPQIAKVHDQFIEEARDYLVLEYVPGRTLRQMVSVLGPQSERQTLSWFLQIARILKHLHEQSPPIVHRDVTPDNLVVREDGSIVMIDFGAANEYLGAATGTMIGKQAYIPPEQFRGKAQPQSDIYSLGATIFYLLSGKDPLPLSSADPAIASVQTVSPALAALVRHCTEPEVEDRIASVDEVLDKLEPMIPNSKGIRALE